jgi:hypothetical protein
MRVVLAAGAGHGRDTVSVFQDRVLEPVRAVGQGVARGHGHGEGDRAGRAVTRAQNGLRAGRLLTFGPVSGVAGSSSPRWIVSADE